MAAGSSRITSATCSYGFNVSVDITERGKCPPPLRTKTPCERLLIDAMIADGVLEEGPVEFYSPHFFIYESQKVRLWGRAGV
jgi:hypothetical protein